MKKKNILKAIGIMFLVYVVLSWFVPGGSFTEATFTKDTTYPLGIADMIMYPIATFFTTNFAGVSFWAFGVTILLIGGLYGVMNQTGVYPKFVDMVVKKFNKKKKLFLIISVLVFAILASLTTLSWPLLALVPFFVAVICLLGYDHVTAFLATVGALLVGNLATVFGYQSETVSYFNVLFGNETTDLIVVKIVLFVVCLAILLAVVLTKKPAKRPRAKKETKVTTKKETKVTTKKGTKKKEEEIKEEVKSTYLLYRPGTSKKKVWPMVTIVIVMVLITLIGMYNWSGAFGVKFFNNIHSAITSFKINNYAIFADLLGMNNPLFQFEIGKWGHYNFLIVLILTTLIIAKCYHLSFKEALDGFISGVKEMLPTALLVVLANLIYLIIILTYTTGKPLFFSAMASGILGTSKVLNLFRLGLTTALGSTMFNELPYLAMVLQQPLTTLYAGNYGLVQVIMSSIFGFMMLVLPTSVILVAGLGFTDLSWKEYVKGTWKFLLGLLVAIILVMLLFMYCPGIKVM